VLSWAGYVALTAENCGSGFAGFGDFRRVNSSDVANLKRRFGSPFFYCNPFWGDPQSALHRSRRGLLLPDGRKALIVHYVVGNSMSKLTYETYGDALIATFTGTIANHEATQFQDELAASMGRARHVVLDLTEADDVSDEGYRMMLGLYHAASMRGGRMALVGLNDEAAYTVNATGFGEFLMTCEGLEEALCLVRGDALSVAYGR
jgi:anti-anti-sigma factor